jgi:hypothetical protein
MQLLRSLTWTKLSIALKVASTGPAAAAAAAAAARVLTGNTQHVWAVLKACL